MPTGWSHGIGIAHILIADPTKIRTLYATVRLPSLVRDTVCVALVWKEFSKSTTGARLGGEMPTVGSTVRSSCGSQ